MTSLREAFGEITCPPYKQTCSSVPSGEDCTMYYEGKGGGNYKVCKTQVLAPPDRGTKCVSGPERCKTTYDCKGNEIKACTDWWGADYMEADAVHEACNNMCIGGKQCWWNPDSSLRAGLGQCQIKPDAGDDKICFTTKQPNCPPDLLPTYDCQDKEIIRCSDWKGAKGSWPGIAEDSESCNNMCINNKKCKWVSPLPIGTPGYCDDTDLTASTICNVTTQPYCP